MTRPADPAPGARVRGTAVAVGGRALLITGPSGAGKSSLALEMISRGAALVADDLVALSEGPDGLMACAPSVMRGAIEARGLGLIRAPSEASARLVAVVDLSRRECARLPPRRVTHVEGHALRLFHQPATPSFAAALHVYLLGHAD